MTEKKKIRGFFEEFRTFAMRGNVVDLAVGVIIGTAFGAITNSLVGDILMPLAGLLIGGIDLSDWVIHMRPILPGNDPVSLNIGTFVQTVIDFFLLALAVFCIVRAMNALRDRHKKAEAPAAPGPSAEAALLTEIRDILKERDS